MTVRPPRFYSVKMMNINQVIILSGLSLVGTMTTLIVTSFSISARPNPDTLGICYYIIGDSVKSSSPCVISTGYGTGVHYEIQNWTNGNKVEIYIDHTKEKPIIKVNGKKAIEVNRSKTFFHKMMPNSPESDSDSFPCLDIVNSKESFCSFIKD